VETVAATAGGWRIHAAAGQAAVGGEGVGRARDGWERVAWVGRGVRTYERLVRIIIREKMAKQEKM